LKLTSGQDLRRGGDSGPVIVPGKPEESLLIKAVRYNDPDLKMPPTGKLSSAQIAAFETWVRLGAAIPQEQANSSKNPLAAASRSHWAFRPLTAPPPPSVHNAGWVRTSIDAFVLAQVEAGGLTPSPPADRRALLRRAYFDLIGLPPTWEEVEAFEQDP